MALFGKALFYPQPLNAAPTNSISIPNSFSPNTTISSSATNSNNNEVQTKFNAHSHTDITQLGTVTVGVWNGTAITQLGTVTTGVWNGTAIPIAYGGTGASSLGAANINLYTDTRFKVGNFSRDISTATGTQQITGLTFQPKAIIFIGGVDSVAGQVSWGIDDCNNNVGSTADTNGITANTYSQTTSEKYAINIVVSSGNQNTAYVSATDSTSFTLTWTKTGSPTGTAIIHYIAFR